VRQTATARGQCRVSAALGAQRLWSADACIATRKQMRFVSPDAAAALVLDPLPDSDEIKLGALWREGRHVADLTPASLRLARDATRIEGGRLHWLDPRDQKAIPEGVQVQLLKWIAALDPLRRARHRSSAAAAAGRPRGRARGTGETDVGDAAMLSPSSLRCSALAHLLFCEWCVAELLPADASLEHQPAFCSGKDRHSPLVICVG